MKIILTSVLCLLSISIKAQSDFSLCDDVDTQPYYYPELTFAKDFWWIKNHFKKDYNEILMKKLEANSGMITIQFKVNCHGDVGDYKLQTCGLNYQYTELAPELSSYFMKKTMALKAWQAAQNDEGVFVNSHKFFSFRIEKGVLKEILPK